jgi:hypothetical protein
MLIFDDWAWVKGHMSDLLDRGFEAELEKQTGKFDFWHEMDDYQRLIWLLSDVQAQPEIYGDVPSYLHAIGADGDYWSKFINRYHQVWPHAVPTRDTVVENLNSQVIMDEASLRGRWNSD